MSRYDKLLAMILSQHDMEKKSNAVFSDWTPHNIRRLIIGVDKAIIQYHVTGGRVGTLTQIVEYTGGIVPDMEALQEDQTKVKSLIGVLVDKRICSAIEEIVFCISGYNSRLFNIDYDMSKLVPTNGNIENRFPRLAKVYWVNSSVDQIESIVRQATDPMSLLLPELQRGGVQCQVKHDCNKQWYYGNTKFWNSAIYLMDAEDGTLYRRLSQVADKYREQEKELKLKETLDNRDAQIVANVSNYLKAVSDYIIDMENREKEIIANFSYTDKVRFGMYIMPAVKAKYFCNLYIKGNADISKIHWMGLKVLFEKYAPELLDLFYRVYNAVQGKAVKENEVVTVADQYKKDELYKSGDNMKKFYQLTRKYFTHLCNMELVSLLWCLSPVGMEFAEDNYKSWGLVGAENISYSVVISEELNNIVANTDRDCGKVLRGIGCTLVSEDNIKSPTVKYNNSITVLDMLAQYSKTITI